MMGKIHVIARAYIKDNDYILVANSGKHLFLPGGHVKYGEAIYRALSRELAEEIEISSPSAKNI